MIDTLVMSGGGPNGIIQVAILQTLVDEGHLNIAEVKHCYCTSAGSLLATLLMFVPLSEIADYLIQRPWSKWMTPDVEMLANGRGLCDAIRFKETLEPFFKAYDVPIDITFQQFYDRFGVDMHVFTTDVRTFNSHAFQRSSHPNVPLTFAACVSSAIYPIFSPLEYESSVYMDGGFSDNFPTDACFSDGRDPETTLALVLTGLKNPTDAEIPSGGIQFLTYLIINMMVKLQKHAVNMEAAKKARICMEVPTRSTFSSELWDMFLDTDPEPKQRLFSEGKSFALDFLEKMKM